ncbi:MAG: hypothetical protein Pg6C_09360 [Treponemataceae bacterium]|nr:MAG: hypothetical protein Pg6C_09360 [Treponemataceae bacterium]
MIQIFRFLLIYLIIACCITFAIGYFVTQPAMGGSFETAMPYGGIGLFRAASAVLLILKLLPAILCAGFVCGASRAFGSTKQTYRMRFSPAIMRNFRQTMICAIICTALVFAADEIVMPLLSSARQIGILRTEHLNEYIAKARQEIDAREFLLAEKYVNNALKIAPKNADVLALLNLVEYGVAEIQADKRTDGHPELEPSNVQRVLPGSENYTSFELLQKAQKAYADESWFDAHFYASTALEISTERDPNYASAKRLASEAWNKLTNPGAFSDAEAAAFFGRKREGYHALMEHDDLKAYYIFADLNQTGRNDSDVEHYLQTAAERIRANYFFIEDIPDIGSFVGLENIFFAIEKTYGGKDIVCIRGISPLKDSGNTVLFLRDLTIISYNAAGDFEMSFNVPFAKMFAQPVSAFDERMRMVLGVTAKTRNIPRIMLEGVDSRTGEIMLKPDFLPKEASIEANFALLAMPYADLLALIDSTHGLVRLDELFNFALIADKYGFSKEVYLQALCSRIAKPLIFIIIMLIAAIAAWNFRLSASTYFKLLWIIIPPILTGFAYLIIEAAVFFVNNALYSIISIAQTASLMFVIVFFIFLFIIISLIFMSRRDAR